MIKGFFKRTSEYCLTIYPDELEDHQSPHRETFVSVCDSMLADIDMKIRFFTRAKQVVEEWKRIKPDVKMGQMLRFSIFDFEKEEAGK